MLGTIILQSYRRNQRKEIVKALDNLCNPNDTYGWSSSGLYAYWNYYTKELLYIGLTINLTERFKQHNGFYPKIKKETCKHEKIEKYFETNEKIGFSILVQSSISQPNTAQIKNKSINYPKDKEIKYQEGLFIESYKLVNGKIPNWNKMNGDIKGKQAAKIEYGKSLEVMANKRKSFIRSESSLFEISENSTFEGHENFLHSVRLLAQIYGVHNAFQSQKKIEPDRYKRIIEDKYLHRELNI